MSARGRFLLDLIERAVWTFIQAFAASVTADALDVVALDVGDRLTLGAIAGGYAVLKAVAAGRYGRNDSAALLPGEPGL